VCASKHLLPMLTHTLALLSCDSCCMCRAPAPLCRVLCAVSCCLQVPVGLVQEVLQVRGGEGSSDLQSKYDRFAMRSFVEDNRALVWCTGVCVEGDRKTGVVLWCAVVRCASTQQLQQQHKH
jgi:hypothetical protein